jgi:hypothetical protein
MPHPRFFELLEEMKKIHLAKDHDYAGEVPFRNLKKSKEFGVDPWLGAMVRMSDKWSRLEQLATKDPAVVDESFYDTLIDLANYSLICYILREEQMKDNEKQKTE